MVAVLLRGADPASCLNWHPSPAQGVGCILIRMTNSNSTPIVSRVLDDGTLIETLYTPARQETMLAIAEPGGKIRCDDSFTLESGERLVPYSATNNLLTSACVLLPSEVGELGDVGTLVADLRAYFARYVSLSDTVADIAPYYVLLTWVYDAFGELPYLRFRGDFGTGKTRVLLAVGSVCYKPFFASGASTVSPIFHILDAFRGTLVLDEADFRFSDATSELTKVLNNGSVDGLPVLRTMANRHRELNPQAFRVFGPKILGMRGSFADDALESRFLTEETSRKPLPGHIPIHTPAELRTEALLLRNRLLAWRFAARSSVAPKTDRQLAGAPPRLNQTALALLSLIDDAEVRGRVAAHLMAEADTVRNGHARPVEANLLAVILDACNEGQRAIRISDITERYNYDHAKESFAPATPKWIGSVMRSKFGVQTTKSHGVYVISQAERPRIERLARRFGVAVDELSPAGADRTPDVIPSANDQPQASMGERQ